MSSEPEIRVAAPEDADAVRTLVAAFRDHLGASRPSDAELAAVLPTALSDASLEFLVALAEDGEPLGYTQTRFFSSVWAVGMEAHLEDLFVAAGARAAGVGTALLRATLARASVRGAGAMGLLTNERNEAALRLYVREGFTPAAEAIFPGGREIRLVATLDPARSHPHLP